MSWYTARIPVVIPGRGRYADVYWESREEGEMILHLPPRNLMNGALRFILMDVAVLAAGIVCRP